MKLELLIPLISFGAVALIGLLTLIVALVKGEVKEYTEQKMIEAEKLELSGKEKLTYVIEAVNEKYKIMATFVNIKKFIEHIIYLSKQINVK